MLEVDIDKILPVTEARDNFNRIIDEVEGTDHMYVLTKNGKPSAVVVGVNHLEKLTGKTADELTSIVEKKADETPVVEEVKSKIPADSVGTPIPQDDIVAGGSKPLETGTATGQSIQPGNSSVSPVQSSTLRDEPTGSDSNESESGGPIDVPVDTEISTPTVNVGASLSPPEPASAPTSSTQRAPSDSGPGSVDNTPATSVGAPVSNVASNQAPAAAPTEKGAAANDSDLFV